MARKSQNGDSKQMQPAAPSAAAQSGGGTSVNPLARLGAFVGQLITGGAINDKNLQGIEVTTGVKHGEIVEDGLTGSRILTSTEITSSLTIDVAAQVDGEIDKAQAEADATRKHADGDLAKARAEADAILAQSRAKPVAAKGS